MPDDWFDKYEGLRFERRDHGILWMTIDRPESLNATTAAMHYGLSRVWDDIDDDPDTRVVVVTGEGKAFSAGGRSTVASGASGAPPLVLGAVRRV